MYLWNFITDTYFKVERVSGGYKVVDAALCDQHSIGEIFLDQEIATGWWKLLDHRPY